MRCRCCGQKIKNKVIECSYLSHGYPSAFHRIDYCSHPNAPTTDGYNRVCVLSECPAILERKLPMETKRANPR